MDGNIKKFRKPHKQVYYVMWLEENEQEFIQEAN